MITVSIVSHGHGIMTEKAIGDVLANELISSIIVTLNVHENIALPLDQRITVLENLRPRGFSANHNQAFALCKTSFFCVLNPDVRLGADVFRKLAETLEDREVAIAAPLVKSLQGSIEDSARHFPTPLGILRKAITGAKDGYDLSQLSSEFDPDWVAGMCMLFRSETFKAVRGFDEKYFLYYEDVDVCRRIRERGLNIRVNTNSSILHDARRDSWKSAPYLLMHLASMSRYFFSIIMSFAARLW